MMVVVVVIWGTHIVIAKAAIDVLPPFLYNAMRFPIGALVLFLILRVSGARLTLSRQRLWSIAGAALIGFIGYQFFLLHGLKRTTVANSVLIGTVAPAGIVLFNIFTRRERGSRRIFAGVALAFGGVLLVIVSRYAGQIAFGGQTLLGDFLSIVGAGVWVASTIMQRSVMEGEPALIVQLWLLIIGSIEACIAAIPDALAFNWSLLTPNIILLVVYAGIVPVGLASGFWAYAIKRLGTSRASLFINLQPIVAASVAILFLGEPFTPWLVIGTAVVLTGMWLIRRG